MKDLIIVDFENVQSIEAKDLSDSNELLVIVGSAQNKIPTKIAILPNIKFIQLNEAGKNSCDFYIAYQIGCILTKEPNKKIIILSKDKGFDPLIKQLINSKYTVSRIETLSEEKSTKAPQKTNNKKKKSSKAIPVAIQNEINNKSKNSISHIESQSENKLINTPQKSKKRRKKSPKIIPITIQNEIYN